MQDLFAHNHDDIAAHPDKVDRFFSLQLIADLVRFEASDDAVPVRNPVNRRVDQNIGSHQSLDCRDIYRQHRLSKVHSGSQRRNHARIVRRWLIHRI